MSRAVGRRFLASTGRLLATLAWLPLLLGRAQAHEAVHLDHPPGQHFHVYTAATHATQAPHAESADPGRLSTCPACLLRLQSSGARLIRSQDYAVLELSGHPTPAASLPTQSAWTSGVSPRGPPVG